MALVEVPDERPRVLRKRNKPGLAVRAVLEQRGLCVDLCDEVMRQPSAQRAGNRAARASEGDGALFGLAAQPVVDVGLRHVDGDGFHSGQGDTTTGNSPVKFFLLHEVKPMHSAQISRPHRHVSKKAGPVVRHDRARPACQHVRRDKARLGVRVSFGECHHRFDPLVSRTWKYASTARSRVLHTGP